MSDKLPAEVKTMLTIMVFRLDLPTLHSDDDRVKLFISHTGQNSYLVISYAGNPLTVRFLVVCPSKIFGV